MKKEILKNLIIILLLSLIPIILRYYFGYSDNPIIYAIFFIFILIIINSSLQYFDIVVAEQHERRIDEKYRMMDLDRIIGMSSIEVKKRKENIKNILIKRKLL